MNKGDFCTTFHFLEQLQCVSLADYHWGKKWKAFNSEKVASSLAYVRNKGKTVLIGHFQTMHLELMFN
jgi:hypothetical protein